MGFVNIVLSSIGLLTTISAFTQSNLLKPSFSISLQQTSLQHNLSFQPSSSCFHVNRLQVPVPVPSGQLQSMSMSQSQSKSHPQSNRLTTNLSPRRTCTSLSMSQGEGVPPPPPSSILLDPTIRSVSLILKRTSWISWWAQMILTTISAVTLLFAKGVLNSAQTGLGKGVTPGTFFLAGSGISVSFFSIIWTWGGARLSRRLLRTKPKLGKNNQARTPYTKIRAANSIRRVIRIGTVLNLFGMAITLLGAEQIVGVLAAKVLTMQGLPLGGGFGGGGVLGAQSIQPLDILIVQANTNTLLSHFVSLVCGLWLVRSVHRLDPPSIEEG